MSNLKINKRRFAECPSCQKFKLDFFQDVRFKLSLKTGEKYKGLCNACDYEYPYTLLDYTNHTYDDIKNLWDNIMFCSLAIGLLILTTGIILLFIDSISSLSSFKIILTGVFIMLYPVLDEKYALRYISKINILKILSKAYCVVLQRLK